MASANEALATSNPEDLDIENLGEGEGEGGYVEMVRLERSLSPFPSFRLPSFAFSCFVLLEI